MDFTRGGSPPSPGHIHDEDYSPSQLRSRMGRSSGRHHQSSIQSPMSIPGNVRGAEAPPPLPPPRFLPNLADGGEDPGWSFANTQRGSFGRNRGSAHNPSHFPQSWKRESQEEEMSPDQSDFRRRQSSTSTVRSLTESERRYESRMDEGYYSLSGPMVGNTQSVAISSLSTL